MRYHNITKDDMLNGDGLRVVLWVAGCAHHCEGCQNPITWNENKGLIFNQDTKNELYEQLNKDYISGITFSGGDPLHCANRVEIIALCKEIREKYPNKTIWLYTGYTYEEILSDKTLYPVLSYLDVLVDGKFILSKRDVNLQWKGSSNQRVINVKRSLKEQKVILHAKDYYKEM